MLVTYHHEPLDKNWGGDIIEKCCKKKPEDEDPCGGDCCSDSWQNELNEVKTNYSKAVEEARQAREHYDLIRDRRDQLKVWWDELKNAEDLVRDICQQFELIVSQSEKIHINAKWASDAIRILYCMVRDFYMQVDELKKKYDRLIKCIECLKHPALSPGQGIRLSIDNYGKQLDIVIATRDEIVKLLMAAIQLSAQIWKNVDGETGLEHVICIWHKALRCDKQCDDCADKQRQEYTEQSETLLCKDGWCELKPILSFPICLDPYFVCVKNKYEADDKEVKRLFTDLVKKDKRKESLLACKQSLENAIKEVDPKSRCK